MKARGFIYQTDAGQWVLATEPNLKSCCLGKEGQIYLEGDFSACSAHQAYTVKGSLLEDHLLGAQIVEKGAFPFYSILLIALLVPIFKNLIKP